MSNRFLKVGLSGAVLALLAGCASPDDSEGVDEARSPQIQLSPAKDWRQYTFTFENNHVLARVLVMTNSVGSFSANTEYWYVITSNLQYLGAQDFTATYTEDNGTPPSLSGSQEFTQAANQTWSTFTSDPVSGGYLYNHSNIHLRIKTSSGAISQLTWYQTLGEHDSLGNVTPSGVFAVGSGSVSVPSGDTGYDIDATLN